VVILCFESGVQDNVDHWPSELIDVRAAHRVFDIWIIVYIVQSSLANMAHTRDTWYSVMICDLVAPGVMYKNWLVSLADLQTLSSSAMSFSNIALKYNVTCITP